MFWLKHKVIWNLFLLSHESVLAAFLKPDLPKKPKNNYNYTMKKIGTSFLVFLWILSGIGTFNQAIAQTDLVNISVFERHDCAHCIEERAFLTELQETRDDISVTYINVYEEENKILFDEVAELEGLSKSTPITLIGNTVIQGFDTAETTGKTFLSVIDDTLENLPEEHEDLTFEKLLEKIGRAHV